MRAAIERAVGRNYERYFKSGLYLKRYPHPNPASLKYLKKLCRQCAAQTDHRIVDFGCGNGRYLFPLLTETHASFIGFDISEQALLEVGKQLADKGQFHHRVCLYKSPDAFYQRLSDEGPIHLIMLMFGVLSHIPTSTRRISLLKQLADHLSTDGRLVLSVPNRWRRFYRNQWQQRGQHDERGDIHYLRRNGDQDVSLFYHLYHLSEIKGELHEAGLVVESVRAESLFPESWVSRSPMLSRLDALLCACLPKVAGYGFLITARRMDHA